MTLSQSEREKLLFEWNDTRFGFPSADKCLHHLFEGQAAQTPQAVAVFHPTATSGPQSLTYRELDRRANQLAHHLQRQGIGPDVVVAISMERSLEMVIAVLGVLKAGGCYAPLDPHYPRERLAFMLTDTQAPVVLTQQHLLNGLPAHSGQAICLDGDWDVIDRESAANPASEVTPDNLTYVIYTSGSTGKPKGVALGHRALVNLMAWQLERSSLGPGSRTLQFASLSFDVSCQELFATWCSGGTLVLISEEIRRDSVGLLQFIVEHSVERLFVPFVALQGLADAADSHHLYPPSLREIVTAGEQLQVNPTIRNLFTRLEGCILENQYGPSESHVITAYTLPPSVEDWAPLPPIGRPIANSQTFILDEHLEPVPVGETGELYLGGVALARGYLNRPELTAERFIANPFSDEPQARLYKTGDLARYQPDGNIEFLGRIDHQVKIRGFRVELGEIETTLSAHPAVKQAVVIAREEEPGDKRLVAYLTMATHGPPPATELRRFLMDRLPEYMVPARFVAIEEMPKTPSGKVDRRALPAPARQRPELEEPYVGPRTDTERRLARIWGQILKIDRVGLNDNFFELGGDSLLAHRIALHIQQEFELHDLAIVKLFQYATVGGLATYLDQGQSDQRIEQEIQRQAALAHRRADRETSGGVAIIGMAGRFPGADDIDQLWRNLCQGIESTTFFSDDELSPDIDPCLREHPDYVRARGIVRDADKFDAAFFGVTPREAEAMDPQQRVFLEVAWAALEHAGCDAERYDGSIGVYAGTGNNAYYLNNVLPCPEIVDQLGAFRVMVANEKDYVATRVAYKLNLTGPAISLYTACSTSLVAVHHAFHSLVSHQCDMALAGGVSITVPQNSGYLYQEGGMLSSDGHCRPFDARGQGTVFGNGVGVVVLKRLEEALADGDCVYTVIRGTAVNNDGAAKVSFAAPSVEGQAKVIARAHTQAGISPETISYVETHGTATPLGDPIEIEALTQAFRARTDARQFCAIGSIKSNFGHVIAAAGVAGLIKATLSLYHRLLPPNLFYEEPNPNISLKDSPFYVNAKLTEWQSDGTPRRAGVSSFGVGGTNAHVVLEEAPRVERSGPSRPCQLLLLSAKTQVALDQATTDLATRLQQEPPLDLADAAYTLQVGRRAHSHRRFVVCQDVEHAVQALKALPPQQTGTHYTETRNPELVFMFPGQGSQYVNMGLTLYEWEPLFRKTVDHCAEILEPHVGCDIRAKIYPTPDDAAAAAASLRETSITQPAMFTIEYALAKLWQSWGVWPQAMVGHSIGEFTAACLAGVFTLEDALMLIATRGSLMQELPGGSMLSVRLPAKEVEARLNGELSLAAINGPSLCVVAGPTEAVAVLQNELERDRVACQHLHTSHAFHSAMMDPVVEPFAERVRTLSLQAPTLPIVSTVTGDWLTATQATDPIYWAQHMRATVRFADGVQTLWQQPERLLLEVGPRTTTATLARQQARDRTIQIAISSLGKTAEEGAEWAALLNAVGQLWLNGVAVDWKGFYASERRHIVPLPTYPFERKRFWLEPTKPQARTLESQLQGQEVPTVTEQNQTQPSRQTQLIALLKETIEGVSGIDVAEVGPDTTFLEMGLDSLTLTQVAMTLQKEFKVSIAFRQLIEDYTSLTSLAAHLDRIMPPEVLAVKPRPSPPAAPSSQQPSPAAGPAPAPIVDSLASLATIVSASHTPDKAGTLEHLFAQQLGIIARQLELLGQAGSIARPVAPVPPTQVAEQPIESPLPASVAPPKTNGEESSTSAKKQAVAAGARIPPVPGARLGRDPNGTPAWYAPDPNQAGKYVKVGAV